MLLSKKKLVSNRVNRVVLMSGGYKRKRLQTRRVVIMWGTNLDVIRLWTMIGVVELNNPPPTLGKLQLQKLD